MEVTEKGTFCAVLGKNLLVSVCPLTKGSCMWKHRLHGRCMYSQTFGTYNPKTDTYEFTPHEFAVRVGLPMLTNENLQILTRNLKEHLNKELAR